MRTPCSKLEMFIPLCNLIINRNPTINTCVCLDAHGQMYLNQKKMLLEIMILKKAMLLWKPKQYILQYFSHQM